MICYPYWVQRSLLLQSCCSNAFLHFNVTNMSQLKGIQTLHFAFCTNIYINIIDIFIYFFRYRKKGKWNRNCLGTKTADMIQLWHFSCPQGSDVQIYINQLKIKTIIIAPKMSQQPCQSSHLIHILAHTQSTQITMHLPLHFKISLHLRCHI